MMYKPKDKNIKKLLQLAKELEKRGEFKEDIVAENKQNNANS